MSTSSWYFVLSVRTVCTCILQCLQELINWRCEIVSPECYFLYMQDYCIPRRTLFTLLYQKSWQTPVLERPVNDKCSDCDSVQNLWLAIKSMFSTTNCVCNLGSLKIHLFFLNERWYKLWLKIAITYFSNTRFTCKIISALYIWRHIKAGKICFVATATWNRSSPSFLSVVTSPSSTKTCSEKRTVFRERSSRKTVGC